MFAVCSNARPLSWCLLCPQKLLQVQPDSSDCEAILMYGVTRLVYRKSRDLRRPISILTLMESVSGSDAADLKNNLTQTRSFEFSDSTEIRIPFPPTKSLLCSKNNLTQTRPSEFSDSTETGIPISPTKSLLWRTFPFSPSGPATTIHKSSQYLVLMQLISKVM